MSLIATLRMLWHRWYITFPGLLLAGLVAAGIWYAVPPSYERSATELLLPGKNDYPVGSNPLLYLGGLANSADVLTRAVGADNVIKEVTKGHPGTDITVQRDGSTSTPLIVITVTAKTDAVARDVLSVMVDRTATELAALQASQHIQGTDRISIEPITVATESTLQQRTRLVLTVAAGAVLAALALLIAALTEGLSRKRRRRADAVEAPAADIPTADEPAEDEVAPAEGADAPAADGLSAGRLPEPPEEPAMRSAPVVDSRRDEDVSETVPPSRSDITERHRR